MRYTIPTRLLAVCCALTLLFGSTALAQETGILYFDSAWTETSMPRAVYFRTYSRLPDSTYRIVDRFLRSRQPQMEAVALNYTSPLRLVGETVYYYENGRRSSIVTHVDGMRDGRTQSWYPNGQTSSVGAYRRDSMDGIWTWWNRSGTMTIQGVYRNGRRDSVWVWYHPDGRIEAKMNYDDGVAESSTHWYRNGTIEGKGTLDRATGIFTRTWFDTLGTVTAIEKERGEDRVSSAYFNEDGTEHSDRKRAWAQPMYGDDERDVVEFVGNNVVYPEIARRNGIEGTVEVRLVISASGDLVNLTLVRVDNRVFEKEALRVASLLRRWTPGMRHNRPAEMELYLPITFRLED